MYEIKQDVLEYIIKKCHTGGMFPSIVLTQKNNSLFSIQREDDGRSLRMFKWFNFADEQIIPGSVEIGVAPLLRVFKTFNSVISFIEFTGNKFHIVNGKKEAFILYRQPEKVMTKLTFEIKNGIPLLGKNNIPLDTVVSFQVYVLEELSKNMNAIRGEFVNFELSDNFIMTAGGLYDTCNSLGLAVDCSYSGPKNVSSLFTYGFKEMAKTFDSKVHLCFSNKCPGWFYESSKKHLLGVLIPPYTGQEE